MSSFSRVSSAGTGTQPAEEGPVESVVSLQGSCNSEVFASPQPLHAYQKASKEGAGDMEHLVREYVSCAQRIFPNLSLVLLHTKISALLGTADHRLPRPVRDSLIFLFSPPCEEWPASRYWARLRGRVREGGALSSSSSRHEGDLRAGVKEALDQAVCAVSLEQGKECTLSSTEVDFLQDLVIRVYPPNASSDSAIKTLLYHLDVYGYGVMSILSAIYIYLRWVSESQGSRSGVEEELVEMSNSDYLEWVRSITDPADRDGEVSSLFSIGGLEENFKVKVSRKATLETVMVPLQLRPFFVACFNGKDLVRVLI